VLGQRSVSVDSANLNQLSNLTRHKSSFHSINSTNMLNKFEAKDAIQYFMNEKTNNNSIYYGFFQCLIIFFVFIIFVPFILDGTGSRQLYNSDHVTAYLLIEDLLKNPKDLFTWSLAPGRPYVFPDWLIAAGVVALPLPGAWSPLIYSALIMALYSVAGGAILASATKCNVISGTWVTALVLVICGYLTLWQSVGYPLSTGLYVVLMGPFIHTGAALVTLAGAALLIHLLYNDRGPAGSIGLGMLVFVSSFSDPSFVAWFVGPACTAGLLHRWASGRGSGAWLALLMATTAIAGSELERYLRAGESYLPAPNSFEHSIEVLKRVFWAGVDDAEYLTVVILLTAAALLIRGAILTVGLIARRAPTRGQMLEVLLAGICAAGISAPIAARMIFDSASMRYFVILMLVPMIWVIYHAMRFILASPLQRFLQFAPVVLLFFCIPIAVPSWSAALRMVEPRPIQSCIEAAGMTAGLGEYWTAKRLMLMSDRRIHVVPIANGGWPYPWFTNLKWFTERGDNGAPLRLEFIIPRKLDREHLRRVFGAPDRVLTCGGETLWLYASPLSLPGNQYN